MFKAALILAASAALGLATLAVAQATDEDENFYSINDEPGPWYLQRSGCTLAHNATDNAAEERDRGVVVVWFRTGMGADIEFRDRRMRDRMQDGEQVRLDLSIDGVAHQVIGAQSRIFDIGRGYRIFADEEVLDAIAAGRRLVLRRAAANRCWISIWPAPARRSRHCANAGAGRRRPGPKETMISMRNERARAARWRRCGEVREVRAKLQILPLRVGSAAAATGEEEADRIGESRIRELRP